MNWRLFWVAFASGQTLLVIGFALWGGGPRWWNFGGAIVGWVLAAAARNPNDHREGR